jgi:PAS domain S-box-containing protein
MPRTVLLKRSDLLNYGLALGLVAAAIAVASLLRPAIDHAAASLLVLVVPILLSAWWGGWGPALLATLTVSLASWPLAATDSVGRVTTVAMLMGLGLLVSWITARRRQEELVRQQSQTEVEDLNRRLNARARELQTLIDASPIGLAVAHDPACMAISVNPAGARMLRLGEQQNASASAVRPGTLPFSLRRDGREISPQEMPMQMAVAQRCSIRDLELEIVYADGSVGHLYEYATPLLDESGDVQGCLGFWVDLTRLRLAERALHESEDRFRGMADAAPVLIWMAGPDGRHTYFNDRWLQFTGRSMEVELGEGWTGDVHPDDLPAYRAAYTEAVQSRSSFTHEYRLRRADGMYRWILDQGVPRRAADGTLLGYIGSCVDITDRLVVERALRESEAQLRTAFETAAAGQAILDPRTTRFVRTSRRLCEMLGRSEADLRNRRMEEFVAPDAVPALRALVEEWNQPHFVENQAELQMVRPGGGLLWVNLATAVVRDPEGNPLQMIGIFLDTTDRKRAEAELERYRNHLEEIVVERTRALQDSTNRLRMSERMAALGTLSAGLGHDMGNLLLPIRLRLDTINHKGVPEELRDDLKAIATCTDYLQRLSNGLRLLSVDPDQAGANPGSIDLHEWWRDVEPFLKNTLRRGVELERRFREPLPRVAMRRHQLTQAVLNLVQNAGDAVLPDRDGRVCVWAEPGETDEWVRIGVTDNGIGMSDEVRARCLDPFFTRKTRGLSTGLGLALVHGLVQRAGGRIDITSREGEGATFALTLPAVKQETVDSLRVEPGGRGRANVVVADERIRKYTAAILRSMGFAAEQNDDFHPDTTLIVGDESLDPATTGEWLAANPEVRCVVFGRFPDFEGNPRVLKLQRNPRASDIRNVLREFLGIVPVQPNHVSRDRQNVHSNLVR